ncbi:MAG: ergothioneine biosynthesis protein EgtB [Calditrichaceae bacterium]
MERSEILQKFIRVRKFTEELCGTLETEDYVIQPVADVSPAKWHLAHTTWFFETFLLREFERDFKPYHHLYNFLYNSYYYHAGERWDRPERGNLSRPTVKEIYHYREAVTGKMQILIDRVSETQWKEFSDRVILGINHEQQHQELLLTDIKYLFGLNPLYPVYKKEKSNTGQSSLPESSFITIKSGMRTLGFGDKGFCYDNEQPAHQVYVNDFKLQNRLVTNGEYLDFIKDNGYNDFRHWLSDGWDAVQVNKWKAPLYWRKIDDAWFEFTLSGLRKLDLHAPVTHISHYEADAYASWMKRRLPTEAEWEIAAREQKISSEEGNFVDDGYFHPVMPKNPSGRLTQMFGDVWEWTGSAYLPHPGYRRAGGALGEYNGKFMSNQMVLKGGSCATSRDHIRLTYRNFFQPDKRWQFTGIRLAGDV